MKVDFYSIDRKTLEHEIYRHPTLLQYVDYDSDLLAIAIDGILLHQDMVDLFEIIKPEDITQALIDKIIDLPRVKKFALLDYCIKHNIQVKEMLNLPHDSAQSFNFIDIDIDIDNRYINEQVFKTINTNFKLKEFLQLNPVTDWFDRIEEIYPKNILMKEALKNKDFLLNMLCYSTDSEFLEKLVKKYPNLDDVIFENKDNVSLLCSHFKRIFPGMFIKAIATDMKYYDNGFHSLCRTTLDANKDLLDSVATRLYHDIKYHEPALFEYLVAHDLVENATHFLESLINSGGMNHYTMEAFYKKGHKFDLSILTRIDESKLVYYNVGNHLIYNKHNIKDWDKIEKIANLLSIELNSLDDFIKISANLEIKDLKIEMGDAYDY